MVDLAIRHVLQHIHVLCFGPGRPCTPSLRAIFFRLIHKVIFVIFIMLVQVKTVQRIGSLGG